MNRSFWRLTLSATALAVCAFSNNTIAATITVQGSGTAPFPTFNVGTASNAQYLAGPGAGVPISTATINNPGFDNISSISFTGNSGVYAGSTYGLADSPFTLGTFAGPQGPTSCAVSCAEYFAVEPGGTITITFSSNQTTLNLLWGTVDVASGWNLVTTSAGDTITGATINSLLGNPASGTVNAAVEIAGLNPFTSVTFSANSPAFEFDIDPPTSTPLPGALPLFATGLGALGLLGWRRKRKAI
jgi:hypothetical protein